MAQYLVLETFWTDKLRYDAAEAAYQEKLAGTCQSILVSEIAKARQQIQQSLGDSIPATGTDETLVERITSLEAENRELKKVTDDLSAVVKKLESRIASLETGSGKATSQSAAPKAAQPPKQAQQQEEDDDDDDIDLFGSDDDEEEDAEVEKIKQERLEAYQAKKAKKPALIAKSSVLLDIKPWDDETDMKFMEEECRKITMDGLVWGASKLVPLAYGIKKLQLLCVVEDEKVSIDDLSDQICELEDLVQSVDVAAFNKI